MLIIVVYVVLLTLEILPDQALGQVSQEKNYCYNLICYRSSPGKSTIPKPILQTVVSILKTNIHHIYFPSVMILKSMHGNFYVNYENCKCNKNTC